MSVCCGELDPLVSNCNEVGGGHFLAMALDFEVDGERKVGRGKTTWKRWVEEGCMRVEKRGCALFVI